jgi:hypothetical protein
MLRTAIRPVSLVRTGPAHAGSRDVTVNTRFTEIPGVIAHAPVQSASPVATAQGGRAVRVYVGRSIQGTWLFQSSQTRAPRLTPTQRRNRMTWRRPAPCRSFFASTEDLALLNSALEPPRLVCGCVTIGNFIPIGRRAAGVPATWPLTTCARRLSRSR